MIITMIVLGTIGIAGGTGAGLLSRRRRKRLELEERKRVEIDFKAMLQDAGFMLGVWNGWDVKDGYYFTSMPGMRLAWKTIEGQRIAWPVEGRTCSACGWRIWRLCRPYESDGSKWLGHIGAVCPNSSCGRLFKDGDPLSALTAVFNRASDVPDAIESLQRLHEAEREPAYLEALRREVARLESPAPKALPAGERRAQRKPRSRRKKKSPPTDPEGPFFVPPRD